MNKIYQTLFLMLFLSGGIFASDGSDDKERNIGDLSILSTDIIGDISKCLELDDFKSFSRTCVFANEFCKTNSAHNQNTSVRINDEWHRFFSTIVYRINDALFPFVVIPGGDYMMGNPGYQHKVTIKGPLLVQATPVTQKQWKVIMNSQPYFYFEGDNLPVEIFCGNDVQEFITTLNELLAEQNLLMTRLPTKEEWEYFARAGTTTKYFWGDDESLADGYAWYCDNANETTHAVGTRQPNPWGIYDTSGNIAELIEQNDINCPSSILRGGFWHSNTKFIHTAFRFFHDPRSLYPIFGFRLVMSL